MHGCARVPSDHTTIALVKQIPTARISGKPDRGDEDARKAKARIAFSLLAEIIGDGHLSRRSTDQPNLFAEVSEREQTQMSGERLSVSKKTFTTTEKERESEERTRTKPSEYESAQKAKRDFQRKPF